MMEMKVNELFLTFHPKHFTTAAVQLSWLPAHTISTYGSSESPQEAV